MPDFHIIAPAVDTPGTGNAYPAAESFDDYDFNGPRSVHKLTYGQMPEFEPDIRFRLAKGAKLTDVLSQAAISAHGLLINERARKIFEQLRLPPHKFFPATITDHQGKTYQYFWMHLAQANTDSVIDYSATRFYKKKFSSDLGTLDISSDKEFWNAKQNLGSRFMIGLENVAIINIQKYEVFTYPYGAKLVATNEAARQIQTIQGVTINEATNLKQPEL